MKRKILIILAILLIVCIIFSPIIFDLAFKLMLIISNVLNISLFQECFQENKITYSEFIDLLINLITCASSIILGYIVYRLSNVINQHDMKKEKDIQLISLLLVYQEIIDNIKIIENMMNKVGGCCREISTDYIDLVKDITMVCENKAVNEIIVLYLFFANCKQKDLIVCDGVDKFFVLKNNTYEYRNKEFLIKLEEKIKEIENE